MAVIEEVRWGMVGYGDVAERKSGPAFNQVPHSRLVAVLGRDSQRVKDFAERHHIPRWYSAIEDFLRDPEVNAVYIATPPDSHAEYTLRAAQAGKPVYVEKPMARTFAECQTMISACEQAGVPLYVAYYRRSLPAFEKVRALIADGAVGEVRFVRLCLCQAPRPADYDRQNLPWRVRPELSGGGYFYDLASHQLDYLDWLFGPVVSAAGQAVNQAGLYPAEDAVSAAWKHASNVLGSGTWCFTVPPAQHTDQAVITGSQGQISFSFFDTAPVRLERKDSIEEFLYPRRDPIQLPLVQQIVNELRGAGSCPSTGYSAARTNRVMEEIIYRAGQTGEISQEPRSD